MNLKDSHKALMILKLATQGEAEIQSGRSVDHQTALATIKKKLARIGLC